MKVDYNKSELAPLGRSRMEIYTQNFSSGMQITVDKIKILGITIPTNGKYEDLIKLNYDEKKAKIKINIIQSWIKRSLTLFGKVTIIKSLIVPQLTYLLSVLPNTGQNYLKDIDSLIFNFLWDNKPPKIKREVILQQKATQGGLNFTDIYTYSKSVKFQWVKKLLDSSFESSWNDIIKLRYHIFNQNFIFNCDLNTSDIDNITMKDIFWTDLLKFFFELKSREETS